MAKDKFPKEEWKDNIDIMTYDELQRCIADPNTYYPEYLDYVKSRMTEIEGNMVKTREVFLKTLRKRRIKYESANNENKFHLKWNRKTFIADLDTEGDFVIIYFIHNIFIEKEEEAKLSRLKEAVNAPNMICSVRTYYEENEDCGHFFVVSAGSINFITENPNFETELMMILHNCLDAEYIVNGLMKRKNKRRD